MRICILGAGVVGLTTAWQLCEDGHEVVVIDRNTTPGAETSFGNGAQLSYAFVSPLASPDIPRKLPALLMARDPAIRIRPQLDFGFLRWGLQFLQACTADQSRRTTRELFALAALSRRETARAAEIIGTDFGLRTAGKLVLYRESAQLQADRRNIDVFQEMGVSQHELSATECLTLEPALKVKACELAGGIFTPSEQVGDCARFCAALADYLKRRPSVHFRLGSAVVAPIMCSNEIVAVKTETDTIEFDVFVLCFGAGSARFARQCGLRVPIVPMKGYSITVRPKRAGTILQHSVTDFSKKNVYAPLTDDRGPAIRVAGLADFVGADLRIDDARLSLLTRATHDLFDIDVADDIQPWAGLRPATPDGRPLIGWSSIQNLFLNTGHGGLGWTLACGSASLVRRLLQANDKTLATSHRELARLALALG